MSSRSSSRHQHTYLDKTLDKKTKNKWDDDIQYDIKIPKKSDLLFRKRSQHFNFRNASPPRGYGQYEPMPTSYQTRSVAVSSPSFKPIQTPPYEIQSEPTTSSSHDPRNSPSYDPSHDPRYSPSYDPSHDPRNSPSYNAPDSTLSPSHDPFHDPRYSPSYDPSHDPRNSPSYNAPDSTLSPSHDPRNLPSYQPFDSTISPSYDPMNLPPYQSQEEELNPSLIGDFTQMSIYHDNLSEKHDQVSYRINKFAEYGRPPHYPFGFPIQKIFNHGQCATQMTPLIYMFLGNFFETYSPKTPNLDFKMYASPSPKEAEKIIETPDFFQKQTIEFWMNLIAKEDKTIFLKGSAIIDRVIPILRRRCLTFSLEAINASDKKLVGHRITLMIQRHGNGPIDLVIFDNRPSDNYDVNIHEYILDAMLEYTKTQISKINGRYAMFNSIQINKYFVDTDTHLKYDEPFMTCISISLRTCIYLSIIKDFSMIKETDSVYDSHLSHFTQQLRQMIHWIYNSMEYRPHRRIPIRSPEMTKLVFPIQKSHCYLGFIYVVELPEMFISRDRNTKIKYFLDHGDPKYYDYSNDEENTFVPRHSPIKNVCVTQSRFIS
jgi:hypothetical protein